jgi:hypothetical protein
MPSSEHSVEDTAEKYKHQHAHSFNDSDVDVAAELAARTEHPLDPNAAAALRYVHIPSTV